MKKRAAMQGMGESFLCFFYFFAVAYNLFLPTDLSHPGFFFSSSPPILFTARIEVYKSQICCCCCCCCCHRRHRHCCCCCRCCCRCCYGCCCCYCFFVFFYSGGLIRVLFHPRPEGDLLHTRHFNLLAGKVGSQPGFEPGTPVPLPLL